MHLFSEENRVRVMEKKQTIFTSYVEITHVKAHGGRRIRLDRLGTNQKTSK